MIFLMNLWGRKWSPHPIPLPSWDCPPPLSSFCLPWHLHLPKSHIEYRSAPIGLVLWILHGAEFSSQPTLHQEHRFCRVIIWSCNPTHGRISRQNHNSKRYMGICLVVQWRRLCSLQCGGCSLIPEQGAGSHMLQWRVPPDATETWCSQTNKYFLKKIHAPYVSNTIHNSSDMETT